MKGRMGGGKGWMERKDGGREGRMEGRMDEGKTE